MNSTARWYDKSEDGREIEAQGFNCFCRIVSVTSQCGTAVVRLARADVTAPQIATFTGHSLRGVEAILDAHYLGRDVKLAEIAVMKLETRTKL